MAERHRKSSYAAPMPPPRRARRALRWLAATVVLLSLTACGPNSTAAPEDQTAAPVGSAADGTATGPTEPWTVIGAGMTLEPATPTAAMSAVTVLPAGQRRLVSDV